MSAAQVRRAVHPRQIADVDLGDEVYVGLFVCARTIRRSSERAIFRDVRIIRPAKARVRRRTATTSAASSRCSTSQSGERTMHPPLADAVRGAELDAGRQGADLQPADAAKRGGLSVRPRHSTAHARSTPASPTATTTITCSRSTARCSASAIRAQAGRHRSMVYTVPVGGGTPKRITPLIALLPARLVAGRQVPALHRRARRRVRHLQDPGRRQRHGDKLTDRKGARRRAGVSRPTASTSTSTPRAAGRMQIWRMKPDGTDQEQVTNDEYNNWFPHISPDGQWIAIISFRQRGRRRPSTRTTNGLPAADAAAGGTPESHRLRLRRAGHDQRAVVVARQPDGSPSSATLPSRCPSRPGDLASRGAAIRRRITLDRAWIDWRGVCFCFAPTAARPADVSH